MLTEEFLSAAPPAWGLIKFLKSEAKKPDFQFSVAVDTYLAFLKRIISSSKDQALLTKASSLLKRYYEGGRKSDKARARSWKKTHTRCHKNKDSELRLVFNNNGTIFQGNVQTFNVSQPNIERSENSRSDEDSDPDSDVDSIIYEPRAQLSKSKSSQSIENKLPLEGGVFLEDVISEFAQRPSNNQQDLNLAHLSVIDAQDSSIRDFFTENQWAYIKDQSPRVLSPPPRLADHIMSYKKCNTTRSCRKNAIPEDETDEWDALYDDGRWVDNTMEHILYLLTRTSNLLRHPHLKEGFWDSLYAQLIDNCILRLADDGLFMQRKETALAAHLHDHNSFIASNVRYDGIVQTRCEDHKDRLEFAVIELSTPPDSNSYKDKRSQDMIKLLAGCRAMLNHLKIVVGYDPLTIKDLIVVGILQAGRSTQVFYMSCIGQNLFYLRSGTPRLFPDTIEFMDYACNLLTVIWKVKAIISSCHTAVTNYLKKKNPQVLDPVAEDFL